ncbi:MAG: hypothetical protein MR494_00960, partial [Spirochaetia bacterium]|nr:hypothetical protein [Spirochaetia bacterium]
MKKLLIGVLMLGLGILAFADVSVKKRGDGKFDIHWSYPNPRAQEVYLAGDFTNWGEGKQLMDRDENGGWYFDMV